VKYLFSILLLCFLSADWLEQDENKFVSKSMSSSLVIAWHTTVWGLAKWGIRSTNVQISTNVDRSTNVQISTSAPILPNPCYVHTLLKRLCFPV